MSPHTNMEVYRIAALPAGEVVMSNIPTATSNQVWRLNKDGQFVHKLYKCDLCVEIGALLLLGNDLFVIHTNGTVIQINLETNRILHIYTIENVASVIHTGCLYSDPTRIDTDLLLLAEQGTHKGQGEVFSYRLSTNKKQVHVRQLSYPRSVSYFFRLKKMYFVVCDTGDSKVRVYNKYWQHVRSFKNRQPMAVVSSSETTLVIAEIYLSHISEYTIKGEFIKYLLTPESEGFYWPVSISFHYPFLWVAARMPFGHNLASRFKFVTNTNSTP